MSVHVDYPPRRCELLDDLSGVRGKRVLILEDDVASRTTLKLVDDRLREFQPGVIDLYLGRPKAAPVLEFIDPRIDKVYLAEDHLSANEESDRDRKFTAFFSERVAD